MGKKITTNEAAAILGFSRQHVGLLIRLKRLKGEKRGRDLWVDKDSVEAYKAEREREAKKKKNK